MRECNGKYYTKNSLIVKEILLSLQNLKIVDVLWGEMRLSMVS